MGQKCWAHNMKTWVHVILLTATHAAQQRGENHRQNTIGLPR